MENGNDFAFKKQDGSDTGCNDSLDVNKDTSEDGFNLGDEGHYKVDIDGCLGRNGISCK